VCQYSGWKRREGYTRFFKEMDRERGRDVGRGVCMLTQWDILLLTALYNTSSENCVGALTVFLRIAAATGLVNL